MAVNWSNITDNWVEYATTGYTNLFGDWFYPIVFLGLIGYIYCINRSAFSAAAGICIFFSVYGITGILSSPDIMYFTLISWVVVIFSFAGLFVVLITKKNRGI